MADFENKKANWVRNAVVYHIYPRSFKDTNGDGIGDLNGIIEKLDYLNDGTEKSLGVNAIWMSPVYKSPMADFGYDVSDYYKIDPIFGDWEIFEKLVKEIHRRGMKIIMDFVPNHTSSEHPWFIESKSSRDNPKRDWYIWRDPKPDGSPPTNWLSVFGGPAWTYNEKTKQYYLHSYLPEQPDLNWRNKEVGEGMLDVLKFWLKHGVDGFRTDAVSHLFEDEEFRDDPPNPNYVSGKDNPYNSFLHTYSQAYSQGKEETFDVVNSMCNVLGAYENKFLLSEVYADLAGLMKFYKACTNKIHAPFNFNLISLPWDAEVYRKFIDDFESLLGPDDEPNYVLGNHDQSRVSSRLGELRARLMAILIFTLRGMPFIYYGDEIGMEDVKIPPEKILDPSEKRVPGFGLGRDPERTPMQWNSGNYAGFSDVEPWLPIGEKFRTYNVESELADPKSILNLYRRLIHFRKNSSALLKGSCSSLNLEQKDIFAFIREFSGEKILVLLNFSDKERLMSLNFKKAKIICSSYNDKERDEDIDLEKFSLRSNEGYVIKL